MIIESGQEPKVVDTFRQVVPGCGMTGSQVTSESAWSEGRCDNGRSAAIPSSASSATRRVSKWPPS